MRPSAYTEIARAIVRTNTTRAVPRRIRATTPRADCGSGISFQLRITYAATQPARTTACTMNQSLSLPPALTVSGRFSPVARCSSLRISGFREISSAVSAIIIKIAFGKEMGATRRRCQPAVVWKPPEVPIAFDSQMCCRIQILRSCLPGRRSARVAFFHARFDELPAAPSYGRKRSLSL